MLLQRRRAAVILSVILLATTMALAGCGAEPAQSTDTGPAATSAPPASGIVTTASAIPTTVATPQYDATTSDPDSYVMTTSGVFAANSQKSMETALELGDAVIAYLAGQGDLASLQSLVAPSAQEGLSQMLSLLGEPTGCRVWSTSATGPFAVVGVGLVFADGRSQHPEFALTVVVEGDETAVTAIAPGTPVDPVFGEAVPGADPRLAYLSSMYAYYTAGTVVLGTVIEELPLRRNPLAGTADADGPDGPQPKHEPVVYKGYVLEVERAYGPPTIPARITVYALGNGTIELDGATQEVREGLPLDAKPGDRLLVPLMKVAYYGTPALEPDEYWVQANWAAFAVNDDGVCARVTGQELDPESGHEFPLSELEGIILGQDKEPSRIE